MASEFVICPIDFHRCKNPVCVDNPDHSPCVAAAVAIGESFAADTSDPELTHHETIRMLQARVASTARQLGIKREDFSNAVVNSLGPKGMN